MANVGSQDTTLRAHWSVLRLLLGKDLYRFAGWFIFVGIVYLHYLVPPYFIGKVVDLLSTPAGDSTLIIIAHRLSSLRGVDRVIILDEGKIVEAGRFEELSRDPNSRFGKMWRTQQGAN